MRKPPIAGRPARARVAAWAALWLVGLGVPSGYASCATGPTLAPADLSVEQDLRLAVREIRGTRDRRALRGELVHLRGHLRRVHGTTPRARRARRLALQGIAATLEGIESQLEFSENDSGEVAEATKDAKRADRYLRLGANRLRAAGRALGVRIGDINGY